MFGGSCEKQMPLLDLSTSHHSVGCLSIGEPYTRLLHYAILHYLSLTRNTFLTLLMFTPVLARSLSSSSDIRILSIPNVKVRSYGQHGILCHLHSDINRNLIASSELWKLICFLSINELNNSIVLCYFHSPTINTTLVINKLRHISYYWH